MFYCPRCRNELFPEAHACNNCGYELTAAPLPYANAQSPVLRSPGLIRPIGAFGQPKRATNSAHPAPSAMPAHDLPVSPQPTPAHLLALTPATPPDLPALDTLGPLPKSQPNHHLIRPVFIAPSPPLEDLPSEHIPTDAIEVFKGRPQLPDKQESLEQQNDDESFVATSIAAEHWRTSWRNRQRAEAGPATTAARGHSSVPEPLLAMQQSLLRMRALMRPENTPENSKERAGPGFWITILLMLCVIGGLGIFIASTFLPVAEQSAHSNAAFATPQPTLAIQNTPASPATTASQGISLSTPKLTFKAVIGRGNPNEQSVTLTNISNTSPITWTSAAIADDNLSWLFIDNSTMSGRVTVGGSSTVRIGINTAGLKSQAKPYTGHIVFAINQAKQLTLPVELYVQAGAAEIVISPAPVSIQATP
ncbi:MAG TPA: hypothetical protein VEL69_00015 [Ktedonobacteraceae bacterium]|nr:hypothetical protein [Ktedonobacteraceae bacterium]